MSLLSLFSARRQKLYAYLALPAGLLLLSGCSQPETNTTVEQPVPQVGVYTLTSQPINLTTRLPGRVVPFRVAHVRPQVSGVVRKRLFQEGQSVEQGQVLYQIDPAPYQAQLAQAEANLSEAQSIAYRYQDLVTSGAISRQQYDSANAALQAAKAAYHLAQINLEYTEIRAPISGRIGRSLITEGALVTANQAQELARIDQLDPIFVDMNQPIDAVVELRQAIDAGQLGESSRELTAVSLSYGAGQAYPEPGTLQLSEVNVQQSTGTVTLRAQFPNSNNALLPGMFVYAEFAQAVEPNALLVPQQALTRTPKGEGLVMVVAADNTVQARIVETVRTVGNSWLISAGLEAGERVITEGVMKVRPGMKVEPVAATNVSLVTEFN